MYLQKVLYSICLFSLLLANSFGQSLSDKKYNRADSFFKAGNNTEATPLLWQLLDESISDSIRAEVYMHLGIICSTIDKCDSSIYLHQLALPIWITQNNQKKLFKTYNNIGNLYSFKKNYREAVTYFNDALIHAQNALDSVKTYVSLCVLHLKQKHYDTAYNLVENTLIQYPPNTVNYLPFYVHQAKGVFFLQKHWYDSAVVHLMIALNSTDDIRLKANVYNDIAETYRGLQNYAYAFKYQDSSFLLNKNNNWAENLLLNYKTYTALYEDTEDYQKALHYANVGWSLSDSFFDAEKNNAMIDAEARYQNQKTLAEKAIVEKDNVLKQRNLIFTFIALGIVALLAFVAFRRTSIKQKANLLLTQQKQQVQQLANQLAIANDTKARLFSTIGHDLRSPVSSLYASLKMQEFNGNAAGGEMSEQTVRLLDTLEELLIWSKSQMDGFKVQPVKVTVWYFFEDLKEFYTTAAEAKSISIVIDAAKEVTIRTDENLLKTIFRNAISNAIANTTNGSIIQLAATQTANGKMCMSVTNSCREESFQKFQESFDDAEVKSGAHGLGIVLMKEFAHKLGGHIDLAYVNGTASLKLHV